MGSRKYYSIAFIISCSIIMLQLLLTRLFSVILWYHFAFMAVSIAMLGMSCAGLYLYFKKNRIAANEIDNHIYFSSIAAPLYLILTFYIVFNTRIFLRSNPVDILYLGFIYLNMMIPFFLIAYGLSILITFKSEQISKLYFFDLTGAAAGCLLFIPVINYFGAESSALLISVIISLIPLVVAFSISKNYGKKIVSGVLFICLLSALLINAFNKDYKDFFKIKYVKGRFESDLEYSKWNAFSRVAVYGTRFIDWGLSSVYEGKYLPDLKTLDIDACAGMSMIGYSGADSEVQFLKNSITALAYLLKPESPMAVIGAGAGKDVLGAKICGVSEVYAVDINPIIRDIINETYGKFTNYLYNRKGINFVLEDGRSFIRKFKNKFKIIQLSMVDTWAAINSGAMALAENSLYTVEAFQDYFNKLSDDGILTLTRFYFPEKPRESLRVLSLALTAYKNVSISKTYKNIIIVANIPGNKYNTVTFLFKKSPFTPEEIAKITQISDDLKFKIEYIPSSGKIEPNYFTNLIFTDSPEKFYKEYEFDVSPTTDDKPFFFHLLKPEDFLKAFDIRDGHSYNYVAVFILVVSFLIILLMTIALVFIPIIIKIQQDMNDFKILNILGYFACIGIGFMLIETSLIQRYILFLGHPIYALSVVLFSMLIFSGIGSYLTNHFKTELLSDYIIKIIILLVIVLLIYNFVIDAFFYTMIEINHFYKIIIAVFTLGAPSLLLGMPFPLAVRVLGNYKNESIIPWAWAVNGATSVLGSIFAFIFAMNAGFKTTLFLAVFFYVCAAFVSIYLKHKFR